MAECARVLFTIGHSNQTEDEFLELLRQHQIEVLVDVRSAPYSRWAPQFNKETLGGYLSRNGIRYLYLGRELGGRPDPTTQSHLYDHQGHALYSKMAETEAFCSGIMRLTSGASEYRVAVMCSEEDPTHCHRRLLVGKVMVDQHGFALKHIRKLQVPVLETSVRLPQDAGALQQSLFGNDQDESEKNPWRSSQSVLPRSQPTHSFEP